MNRRSWLDNFTVMLVAVVAIMLVAQPIQAQLQDRNYNEAKKFMNDSSGNPAVRIGATDNVPVKAYSEPVVFLNNLTVTAGAYSSGYCIGGLQTITNAAATSGGAGRINSVILGDKAKQNMQMTAVFFDSNPSATTFTDNAALTINDADLSKIVGHIDILASDYRSFADNSEATSKNQGVPFVLSGTANLYYTLMAGGSATYVATTDLTSKVKIDRER